MTTPRVGQNGTPLKFYQQKNFIPKAVTVALLALAWLAVGLYFGHVQVGHGMAVAGHEIGHGTTLAGHSTASGWTHFATWAHKGQRTAGLIVGGAMLGFGAAAYVGHKTDKTQNDKTLHIRKNSLVGDEDT